MIRFSKFFAILALLTGFAAAELPAQGNPDKAPEIAETDKIDEVPVVGPRSLTTLRRELIAAEDNVYAIFNSLNTDDDYDITCRKKTRVGSQLPKRVCETRIYRDKTAETAEEFYEQGGSRGVMPNIKRHNETLREMMRALAAENPELVVALKKRRAIQLEFDLLSEQDSQ